MLPWLIIPLIILWALSQLLPPGFRFEVTSPRLACVGVLLVSLGWYELVMPKLSSWRARRSALLRERKRLQAQEAAKLRKEATRRCRNCLTAYRDQTPGGGRFMCTYCGHVSKRPVLDIPGLAPPSIAPGMACSMVPGGGSLTGTTSSSDLVNGGFVFSGRIPRGLGGRGLPDRPGWGGGRGWASSRPWPNEGGGWTVNGSWMGSSWSNGGGYLGGGASWGGSSGQFGGGIFGGGKCTAGESYSGILLFVLRVFSYLFFSVGWIWRKLLRVGRSGDDSLTGGRRSSQRSRGDGGTAHATRIEKSRRKAEEKRQARLEKELLEAEERKQREDVARLVEERRRQRDEKLEAEKESEREAVAEREREIRREREAERRRQEKATRAKDKNKESETEEVKKKKGNEFEKKTDTEKSERKEDTKSTMVIGVEYRKVAKVSKGTGQETGLKGSDSTLKSVTGSVTKTGSSRYLGSGKGGFFSPTKNAGAHLNSSTSFWGRNFSAGSKFGKVATPTPSTSSISGSNSSPGLNGKIGNGSSNSAWNKIPWTKVWGKGPTSTIDENPKVEIGAIDASSIKPDYNGQEGVKQTVDGVAVTSVSPPNVETMQQPLSPFSSQTKSWLRLFSSPSSATPVEFLVDSKSEQEQNQDTGCHSHAQTLSSSDEIFFGTSSPLPLLTSECSPLLVPAAESTAGPLGTTAATCMSSPMHLGLPGLQKIDVRDPLSLLGPVSDSLLTSFSIDLGTSISPIVVSNPLSPIHAPIPVPISLSSSVQSPHLKPLQVCEDDSHLGEDQVPQILGPWGLPPLSLDESSDNNPDEGRWQMWGSPQLHQIKLPEPSPWILHTNDRLAENDKDLLQPLPRSSIQLSFEPESQLPSCLFSLQQNHCRPKQNGGEFLGMVPVSNSTSIWSDPSAFESALRIWEDSDIHHRVPPEFVDCITQELMQDPVITADGHTYERYAIETWLKSHDTSPKTGEVLPPPPGGNGTGVDKTLRPNHILRGQIIEYKERLAHESRLKAVKNSWSTSSAMGSNSSWSTASSTTRPLIGGFYTTPGVQSVWSYNMP